MEMNNNRISDNDVELSENRFLAIGLHIAGFGPKKLSKRTQLRRFREIYGCDPVVVKKVWYDVQAHINENAQIDHLFWAISN